MSYDIAAKKLMWEMAMKWCKRHFNSYLYSQIICFSEELVLLKTFWSAFESKCGKASPLTYNTRQYKYTCKFSKNWKIKSISMFLFPDAVSNRRSPHDCVARPRGRQYGRTQKEVVVYGWRADMFLHTGHRYHTSKYSIYTWQNTSYRCYFILVGYERLSINRRNGDYSCILNYFVI